VGIELDHAFIGCRPGAPEAEALLAQGFVEGSPNVHPGQGTANRRFFFGNFKLELIWVEDEAEARSERTARTRLWERCSRSHDAANPFGILFRSDGTPEPPPFATWPYHPAYLPAGLAIEFAEGTSLEEPELIYLPFVRGQRPSAEPTAHRLPLHRVRSLVAGVAARARLSPAALAVEQTGLVTYAPTSASQLTVVFEGTDRPHVDLRPALPLILCGAP
jgi:hypothetical protein